MKKAMILFLLLSGCASAYMVSKPGGQTENAPSNEKAKLGVVQYSMDGARGIVDLRRKDAYRQMASACRGKYKIESEGPSGGSTYFTEGAWLINFSCE